MKRMALVLVLTVLVTVPAFAQPPGIHVPVPAGWTAVDQEYRYGRDNLWEYINGAAELFLTYRFNELVVADFEKGEDAVTVSVYDMGSPLDAYGVYETEKPAQAELLKETGLVGVLQPPYRGLLIKDRHYVKIEAGGGDISAEALRDALLDVANGLPGENGLPSELAALPTGGRVPGTVAFAGSDYLGLEDLKACLHADYKDVDGNEYGLFVMKPTDAFLRNESGKWTSSAPGKPLTFTREIPYRGVVVLMGDSEQLIGVSGCKDVEQAAALLKKLVP